MKLEIQEMVGRLKTVLTHEEKRPWRIAQELGVPDDGLLHLALQQAVREGSAARIIKEVPKTLGIPAGIKVHT